MKHIGSGKLGGELGVRVVNVDLDRCLQKLAEKRDKPWLREPNNMISVVAIVISIFGVIYGFMKDRQDSLDKDLTALTAVVNQVTNLDSEAFAASKDMGAQPNQAVMTYMTTLGNRKEVLLSEADRLTVSLGKMAPIVQLAVLGASYFEVGQYEKAKKYFAAVTGADASVRQQINGWRSIALADAAEGPRHYAEAQQAFSRAASIDPNPDDLESVQDNVRALREWGEFSLTYSKTGNDDGVQHLLAARALTPRLECQTGYAKFASDLDQEIGRALAREPEETKVAAAHAKWDGIRAKDSCTD